MKRKSSKTKLSLAVAALAILFFGDWRSSEAQNSSETATPIKHLVVIFQENVSFDHYFATYPNAANPPGEPVFKAKSDTPSVNGLTGALLSNNPNSAPPFRFDRSQQLTCDQQHDYMPEQSAYAAGLMDKFVEFTGRTRITTPACEFGLGKTVVMGYYDGNTVTALWNYAQHFAMSDNSYETTFGPSTPGAVNIVSGQTHGLRVVRDVGTLNMQVVEGTMIGNPRPAFEDCLTTGQNLVELTGRNVGDLLNSKGITWGWFQGGFLPTSRNADGTAVCEAQHTSVAGFTSTDYLPHHEPFQYYLSTANPHHLPPSSIHMIGRTDQANHQYDLRHFWAAALAGNLPEVSFLKAAGYQDGHAEYSDPLDEQTFLVNTINALQTLPQWRDLAVIIAYDDSDGWYDHVMPPIVSQSNTTADALTGAGSCGVAKPEAAQGRCGYGPRLPLLIISPWAKVNYVDHQTTDQTSILRFIEDNWGLGRIGGGSFDENAVSLQNMFDFTSGARARRLLLHPASGLPVESHD
jgi:phospholipase C